MTMTDPIADMLTRVRNAHQGYKDEVKMPSSKLKESLAAILKAEGYISDFQIAEADDRPGQTLSINLMHPIAVVPSRVLNEYPNQACGYTPNPTASSSPWRTRDCRLIHQ